MPNPTLHTDPVAACVSGTSKLTDAAGPVSWNIEAGVVVRSPRLTDHFGTLAG